MSPSSARPALIGRREVKSSNGEREQRYVIETPIRVGDREWRIEVTLANRDMMSYAMLLGRQGIPRDGLVDPNASFLQPKLHYKNPRLVTPERPRGPAPPIRGGVAIIKSVGENAVPYRSLPRSIAVVLLAAVPMCAAVGAAVAADVKEMLGKWRWQDFTIEVVECKASDICAKVIAGPKNVGLDMLASSSRPRATT